MANLIIKTAAETALQLLDAGVIRASNFGSYYQAKHACVLGAFNYALDYIGQPPLLRFNVIQMRTVFDGPMNEADARHIERYFEGYTGAGKSYRLFYPDAETRIRLLLKNLVENDGEFVPERLPRLPTANFAVTVREPEPVEVWR